MSKDKDVWEDLKSFMLRPDVFTPRKPFLPEMFRIYEFGLRKEFPPEWKEYLVLKQLREMPIYEKIITAEEKIGKYMMIQTEEPKQKKQKN